MPDKNRERFKSAQTRLRRIEKVIAPYTSPVEPDENPKPQDWMPSDVLINHGEALVGTTQRRENKSIQSDQDA